MEDSNNRSVNFYPNLKQMWGLFGMFLFFTFVSSFFILVIPNRISNVPLKQELVEWLQFSAYVLSFILTIFFAKSSSHSSDFDYGMPVEKMPSWLLATLIIFVPAMRIFNGAIISLIPMPDSIVEMFNDLSSTSFPSFLMIVIAAPLLEELLCRGIILKGLLKNMQPEKAIFWSAVFFAVMHLNPWQGINAFIIGLISGWIFWQTKSIIPSIFIHLLNNGMSFILVMLVDPTASDQGVFGSSYRLVFNSAAVIFLASLYFIYRKFDKIETQKSGNS